MFRGFFFFEKEWFTIGNLLSKINYKVVLFELPN